MKFVRNKTQCNIKKRYVDNKPIFNIENENLCLQGLRSMQCENNFIFHTLIIPNASSHANRNGFVESSSAAHARAGSTDKEFNATQRNVDNN